MAHQDREEGVTGRLGRQIDEIKERYLAGENMEELAIAFKATAPGIRNALLNAGVTLRTKSEVLRRRWADPEYKARTIAKITESRIRNRVQKECKVRLAETKSHERFRLTLYAGQTYR